MSCVDEVCEQIAHEIPPVVSRRVRLSRDQRAALVALCLAERIPRREMVRLAGGWRGIEGMQNRGLIACERGPGPDSVEMDLVFTPTPAGRDVADGRKRSTPGPRRTPRRVGRPNQKAGIDWDAEPRLGVWFDVDLAAALSVAPQSVRGAREKRNVPPAPRDAPRNRMPMHERRPVPGDECDTLGVSH